MVSEKAAELLGVEEGKATRDEVARAFWLSQERIDRAILETEDAGELGRLLEEKDLLLEARALLEGTGIAEIRRRIVEEGQKPVMPSGVLLTAAVVGWLLAALALGLAVWWGKGS